MDFNTACQLTEDEAREYLEKLRWNGTPVCPHCGTENVAKLNGKATRPGVYKCKDRECRKQFTVTVGTIFEGSHCKLRHWVMAFCLVCSSKKGISALQIKRMLKVAYKTAWHLCHRIRYAMQNEPMRTMLSGDVEVDETWVGPRQPKFKGKDWQENKVAVVALIQRNGPMRTKVVGKVTQNNLRMAIDEAINKDESRLLTDDNRSYEKLGPAFKYGHESVNHSAGEYSRDDVSVNHAECFFSLLKRGIHGTFHHVGKQHLHRYADEFSFRWNYRKVTDSERTEAAIKLAPGVRLQYRNSFS